jgi:ferredoxin
LADSQDKLPANAPGAFYVDVQCIDCDLCRQSAPANFDRNDDEGHSYVVKQPETERELEDCRTALDDCPVEAIGADG